MINTREADAHVRVTGSCGDSMQIWLRACEERIEATRFLADGCRATLACGSAVTVLSLGRTIQEAAAINATVIKEFLGGLPAENSHCAILAAETLHCALAQLIRKKRS